MKQTANATFSLRLNGDGKDLPLEQLVEKYKGDITAIYNDDGSHNVSLIQTVEEHILGQLNKKYPVGGKKLSLLVTPTTWVDGGKVWEPLDVSAGFTSSFDWGYHGMYNNPLTRKGMHLMASFDPDVPEDYNVGYINQNCVSGAMDLGINIKGISDYKWEQIGYRVSGGVGQFFSMSIDYVKHNRKEYDENGNQLENYKQSDARAKAQAVQAKHDYIDFLLDGFAFSNNISKDRHGAIGFLYQLLVGPELAMGIRQFHVNQVIEGRKIYRITHPRMIAQAPVAPEPKPAVSLTLRKRGGGKINLNGDHVGMTVRIYNYNNYARSVVWTGNEEQAKSLTTLQNTNKSYGFELV